jgi:uncharacterized delta-60 repeat protein
MKTRIRPRLEALEARALLNAGDLDLTFGGTGAVMTAVGTPNNNSWAIAVAVQPDLKVVAVGKAPVVPRHGHGGPVWQIGLVRYNPDGTLDDSFGSGGIAMLPANEWYLYFGAAALQPDGKIVVAIAAHGTSTDINWEIFRFNANGSLDTTFGGSGTGKVITAFPGGYAIPWGIAIQPTDGKIVVVGSGGGGLAVARYTTGGTLDTSFGTGGEVITPIGPSGSTLRAAAVAIDSPGRIIVGGAVQGSSGVPALARYNPDGTLDTGFGVGGVQTVSLPPSFTSADVTGLGLQSTGSDAGKIVVSMTGNGLALTRLNPDGSLDGGFGSGGFYVESRMNSGVGLAIQPDDKLIMAGRPNNSVDPYEYVVTRVLADGSSYDPSFGSAGLGQTNFGTQPQAWDDAVALAPDGKIVVAGAYGGSPQEFATVRFQGDTATVGSSTTMTATAVIAPPTKDPSLADAKLVALALDSPDLWEVMVIRPPAKRRGSH